MIIDKHGTKPAYAIASICASLGFFITSYATNYWQYLIPYALFAGIGTGCFGFPQQFLCENGMLKGLRHYVGNGFYGGSCCPGYPQLRG